MQELTNHGRSVVWAGGDDDSLSEEVFILKFVPYWYCTTLRFVGGVRRACHFSLSSLLEGQLRSRVTNAAHI